VSLLLLFNLLIKRIELTSIICSEIAGRELNGDGERGGDRDHDGSTVWRNLTSGNAGGGHGSDDMDTEITGFDGGGGLGGQLLRGRDNDRKGEDDSDDMDTEMTSGDGGGGHGGQLLRGRDDDRRGEDDTDVETVNKVKQFISPNTTSQFEKGINMPVSIGDCAGLSPRINYEATEMYTQMSDTDSVYHGCSPFSKFIVFV